MIIGTLITDYSHFHNPLLTKIAPLDHAFFIVHQQKNWTIHIYLKWPFFFISNELMNKKGHLRGVLTLLQISNTQLQTREIKAYTTKKSVYCGGYFRINWRL